MVDLEYLNGKELSELRGIAENLGIEFAKNIGKNKLIELIVADEDAVDGKPTQVEGVVAKKKETPAEIKKRMNILKRVRISCNDPQYKGRNGVTKQVGNSTAMVGKFVPFDVIYHVQVPIYDLLKAQTYNQTKFVTDRTTGMKVPVVTTHKAFVIEDLDPLTEKELKALAADQSSRGSIPTE